MTIYNWLCLLGFPALITAMYAQFKRMGGEQKALKFGMQAMLRDRLYQLYRVCNERGGATLLERENFENLYKQYHTLGANGVMDDIRQRFISLAIREED